MVIHMQRCAGCMAEINDWEENCPQCGYVKGTPPKEAYHMPPETVLHARYIIGRVLGYGGFGVTYIGWDAQLERKVAVKEFLPSTFATRMPGYTEVTVYGGEATEQFEAGLSRFVDEAKRLAKFNGIPGIVDIYDTFVENNTAYIVMEFLQGQDVKEIINANGRMEYEDAREIVLKICDTLEPVHQEGIIHRDISPDNIYVTVDGKIKLLDFGASRYATSINSKSLSVILKAGYAPEEQYRSRGDQGPWSDVYALAASFYKMLTGETPEDAMERAIRDELREPSKLGAVLPKSAENAIMNALNIRKEDRTQSAAAFKEALLQDGVERVKVKQRKQDSGSMPKWGKVLLGGSAGLLLLFGLLTVTGVVDLGQGNLLKDTFGSAVPAGHVNAPGIVNQVESKAQKMVKDAGLDYLIVGTEYSDKIEKGKILSQDPLPGRIIALGEQIGVRISGGSLAEAQANGEMEVPDLTYKTAGEALHLLEEADIWTYVKFEYSDTIAAGLVTRFDSIEEKYEENTYMSNYLYISAGRDDADNKNGEMRAAYVGADGYATCMLEVAIASMELTDNDENIIQFESYVQYSLDQGQSWNYLKDKNDQRMLGWVDNYGYEGGNTEMSTIFISIEEWIRSSGEDLIGKEINLKVERWEADGDKQMVDTLEVPQTLMLEETEEVIEVNGVQKLSSEEIEVAAEEDYQLRNRLDYIQTEEFAVYKLTGNIEKGRQYLCTLGGRSFYRADCIKEGELLLMEEWPKSQLGIELSILEMVDSKKKEKGMFYTLTSPTTEFIYSWSTNQFLPEINGKNIEEATSQIRRSFGEDISIYENNYYSNKVPEGKVIDYSLWDNHIEIRCSMGKDPWSNTAEAEAESESEIAIE